MLLNRNFVRRNIVSFAIILFVLVYILIITHKPSFLYNRDGSLRSFGVGYKNKTVIPMWFAVIGLAIISYLTVHYYLLYPRISL